MCIIIYSPKSKKNKGKDRIPLEHISGSLDCNPDGWGFMWAPGDGTVQVERGMDKASCLAFWETLRQCNMPIVFHARIGTHGDKTVENCHPFLVPNHGELAVAHNGIISECDRPMRKNGSRKTSDTQNFVDEVLAQLPIDFQTLIVYHRLLRSFIGHSKLVFLRGDGRVDIVNAKKGQWLGSRWYSNSGFRQRAIATYQTCHQTQYYGGANAGGCWRSIGYTAGDDNASKVLDDIIARNTAKQAGELSDWEKARAQRVVDLAARRAAARSVSKVTVATLKDPITKEVLVEDLLKEGWGKGASEMMAEGMIEKAIQGHCVPQIERLFGTEEPSQVLGINQKTGQLEWYSER